jgi:hypothetical protein
MVTQEPMVSCLRARELTAPAAATHPRKKNVAVKVTLSQVIFENETFWKPKK